MDWYVYLAVALVPATLVVFVVKRLTESLALAWGIGGAVNSFLLFVSFSVLVEFSDAEYDGLVDAIIQLLLSVATSIVTTTLGCGVAALLGERRTPPLEIERRRDGASDRS